MKIEKKREKMMMERTILCLLHSGGGGIQLRKRITTRERERERREREREIRSIHHRFCLFIILS